MNYLRYLIIFISLLCWGTYSLFLKIGIRETGYPIFSALISFLAATLTILIIVLLYSEFPVVSGSSLMYLIIGGLLLGIGAASFMIMLEEMTVGVARSLLGLNILIAILTGYLVLGESISMIKWIGIGLAMAAIALLSI